jgi:hypothetical protein
MPYCQGFDYDVFLSYAHRNNWDKWVTDLHEVLKLRLAEALYQDAAIWRDDGGLDGKLVDEGIQAALANSAVFVAVVSGAYLNSKYCCDIELPAFRHPHFPNKIREYSRILSIAYEIPEEKPVESWPEPLRATQFVKFHSPDGPFIRTPRRDPKEDYWRAVEELVRKIKAVLLELKKGAAGAEVAVLAPPVTSAAPAAKPLAFKARWRRPNVHITYQRRDKGRADTLANGLTPRCEVVTLLPHDAAVERQQRHLQNADGHILLFDAPDIPWAEDQTLASLRIAAEQGRPRRVGLLADSLDEFSVRSEMIYPILPANGGTDAFVSAIGEGN